MTMDKKAVPYFLDKCFWKNRKRVVNLQ